MKKKILFYVLLCITSVSFGQIHEAGIILGGSNYIGDIGSENYVNPNKLAFGGIYKYNLNPRIALRGTFTYFNIGDSDDNSSNSIREERGYSFSNSIKEFAVGMEFNFFEFDMSSKYDDYSPYLMIAIGVFNYKTVEDQKIDGSFDYGSNTSVTLPFGFGYKTRLYNRIVLNLELSARYTLIDNLDYTREDIADLNFGNPDANDWYVFTGVSIVYTFGRPACYASR